MKVSHQKYRISYDEIEKEYVEHSPNDDDEMIEIKNAINELSELDRAILVMYADIGSMEKTGKKFGVSAATIYAQIRRIRENIKDKVKYDRYTNNSNNNLLHS